MRNGNQYGAFIPTSTDLVCSITIIEAFFFSSSSRLKIRLRLFSALREAQKSSFMQCPEGPQSGRVPLLPGVPVVAHGQRPVHQQAQLPEVKRAAEQVLGVAETRRRRTRQELYFFDFSVGLLWAGFAVLERGKEIVVSVTVEELFSDLDQAPRHEPDGGLFSRKHDFHVVALAFNRTVVHKTCPVGLVPIFTVNVTIGSWVEEVISGCPHATRIATFSPVFGLNVFVVLNFIVALSNRCSVNAFALIIAQDTAIFRDNLARVGSQTIDSSVCDKDLCLTATDHRFRASRRLDSTHAWLKDG
mmetsp:Transcript_84246/g.163664  ORF Transcript_84246/g.163664 Transcript_84246/m.163664 type:complete len:302 (+) Transcript_84246:42-947(+)